MTSEARRIPLDRRVCIVREGRIDLRPERGAVVLPLIGLAVGLALFAAVALFADSLLGLGTVELVPFWKIERIEVDDFPLGDAPSKLPRPAFDLRAWDILLVKTSGKRLPIGQVISANRDDLIDEGFNRALDAAEAIAAMTGKTVVITAAIEEGAADEANPEPDKTSTVAASDEHDESPLVL